MNQTCLIQMCKPCTLMPLAYRQLLLSGAYPEFVALFYPNIKYFAHSQRRKSVLLTPRKARKTCPPGWPHCSDWLSPLKGFTTKHVSVYDYMALSRRVVVQHCWISNINNTNNKNNQIHSTMCHFPRASFLHLLQVCVGNNTESVTPRKGDCVAVSCLGGGVGVGERL